MSRPPPKTRKDRMVQLALDIANDPTHGYSQKPPSGRWGPDFDCSSLMYYLANKAGFPVGTGGEKVRFTGTMLKDFEKAGFQILPFANVGISDLKIGDILLNLALHAEVYVGNGESVGATSSENGGFVGEAGDQTGREIEQHPVITFDKGWDWVLRPPEDDEVNDEESEEGDDEVPMNYGSPNQNPGQWGNTTTAPNMMSGQNGMNYPMGGWQGGYNPNGGWQQGYNQGYRQGYPQGNLGQMNGYSQANAGYPQNNMMPSGPQGMDDDLCFVMGIEGAKNYRGKPNSRKPLFDEDKPIMYITSFDQNGNATNIMPYQFSECAEEMPQHLSPLMQQTPMGNTMMSGGGITREEVMQMIKETLGNESSNEPGNSGPNQQSRGNANRSNGRPNQ